MRAMEFEKRVMEYMSAQDMVPADGRVLAALSGGADSVCLLRVLSRCPGLSGRVRALHVHHGLRGAEADRDELFVRRLCEDWGIPLTVVRRDVRRYAEEHGLSQEEAGRVLRYEALEAEAQAWEEEFAGGGQERHVPGEGGVCRSGLVRIAVAHHQDDDAETILHHLLRGSGLRGLSGIKPVQGRRIRPLLCARRADILDYLREEGISWCEDSTNGQSGYTRNRIRNEILPLLTREVNSRAVENLLHAGEQFARIDRYLEEQAKRVLLETEGTDDAGGGAAEPADSDADRGGCEPGRARIGLEGFLAQDPVIRSYILRLMLDQAAPGQQNITARHFAQLERLASLPVGSRLDLPGGLTARRDYTYLWIERALGPSAVSGAGDGPACQGNVLQFTTFSHEKGQEIPKNQYTKWFDYGKIKGTLSVRTRQSGDYLTLAGGGRKPLNRYMIDEKIPRQERDQILLLAEGHHILWVIGYRISEYYKITEETQTILQAVKNGGERDGRQNSGVIVRGGSGPQDQ